MAGSPTERQEERAMGMLQIKRVYEAPEEQDAIPEQTGSAAEETPPDVPEA